MPTRGTVCRSCRSTRDDGRREDSDAQFAAHDLFGAAAVFAAGAANANEELMKMSQNPKQWVMPTGDYANQRHSTLKQITAENVGKLQVAWTFSTGVLRGHEGGPLVIGDVMYVHGRSPTPSMRST